jgi:hypothetical protein
MQQRHVNNHVSRYIVLINPYGTVGIEMKAFFSQMLFLTTGLSKFYERIMTAMASFFLYVVPQNLLTANFMQIQT